MYALNTHQRLLQYWKMLIHQDFEKNVHVHLVTDIHVKTDHKSALHLEWNHHLYSLNSFPQMSQRGTFENQNWENRKNWAYHYPFQARSMNITKIFSDKWSAYRQSLFQRTPVHHAEKCKTLKWKGSIDAGTLQLWGFPWAFLRLTFTNERNLR